VTLIEPENSCLWESTSKEPLPECAEYTANKIYDVAIVGAGIMGLSTALHLSESGRSVIVIDAQHPGWGASGRNGGQVQAGFGASLDKMCSDVDSSRKARILEITNGATDHVFKLIHRHKIDCDPVQKGLLRGVHHPRLVAANRAKADANSDLRFLDKQEADDLIGAGMYHGAILDGRAGSINPAAYSRGLCRVASNAGAQVLANTMVHDLDRASDGWALYTNQGTVQAGQVVLATNAYSDSLQKGLMRTMVGVNSFQIATSPIQDGPLAGGHIASDTRRLVFYFRRDTDGRLIVGGRGQQDREGKIDAYSFLRNWIHRNFPKLGEAQVSHYWSGRVAITSDGIPHVHEPEPGLHIVAGFNGKGVALATAMGECLSERITQDDPTLLGLQVTPIRQIPFWQFRNIGVAAHVVLYRLLDNIGR